MVLGIKKSYVKKGIIRHGVPAQIISDNGGDIRKGIENIRCSYPDIAHTYDITHKCAIELKHILKEVKLKGFRNNTWGKLKRQITKQIGILSQTAQQIYDEL